MSKKKETKVKKLGYKEDSFYNPFNGVGGANDVTKRTGFESGAIITLKKSLLEILYAQNWIIRRAVDLPIKTALRPWIDIVGDEDLKEKVTASMRKLRLKKTLDKAGKQARLYGGAAIVMGIVDGSDDMSHPLNLKGVQRIEYLSVIDAGRCNVNSYYTDENSSKYGDPETYIISSGRVSDKTSKQNIIHESRLLIFKGDYIPERSNLVHGDWGLSIIEAANDAFNHYAQGMQAGAATLHDFVLKIFKIKDLVDLVAAGKESDLKVRLENMISKFSNQGVVLIGNDEEFHKVSTPLTGYKEMLELYKEECAAAFNISKSILFGQQTGTLAGASETTRQWYDSCQDLQEDMYTDEIDRFFEILFMTKEYAAENYQEFTWNWRSMWQQSDKEKSEVYKGYADADKVYLEMGVLTPDEARQRFTGDQPFSLEIKADGELDTLNIPEAVENEDQD